MQANRPRLVSFADGAFAPRGETFRKEAENTGLFSLVDVYCLDKLPVDFRDTHGAFMQTKHRGFGYWIWKPVVILEALESTEPGDAIVYLDAGFTVNSAADARFQEYLDIAQDHESRMLSFMNIYTESHWTKADLFAEVGLSLRSVEAKTSQISSGFLVLINTPANRDLLRQWAEIAVKEGYRFSDDSPSRSPNHPDFQEHRHDQSISSLLRKLHGTAVTHYEVQDYAKRFEELKQKFPAWATRLRR